MAKAKAQAAKMWIVTALGKDRPGIVAYVTKILFDLGCNLEDSAMTRLGGEFAIMLAFSAPRTLQEARLATAFKPLSRKLGLVTQLKALTKGEMASGRAGQPYHLSVYGADHPGIVYRISSLLAKLKANITDVSTHRTAPSAVGDKPLYLMMLQVELPPSLEPPRLERELQKLAKGLGVEVSLRSAEAEVL